MSACLALELGIEPRTNRLTADCSTAELLQNLVAGKGVEPFPNSAYEAGVYPLEPAESKILLI